MGKYKILVSYQSGDSFGDDDYEDLLPLEWDNLEIAKKNLQAIKEHWGMYKSLTSYRMGKATNEEIMAAYSDKWWFVSKEESQSYFPEHLMKLEADNGNTMQQRNFWCGYFETLYGAEIICDNSDMKFTV